MGVILASVLNSESAVLTPQPPVCTRPALPPVFTATGRPLPPFLPPAPPRLTLHADKRKSLSSEIRQTANPSRQTNPPSIEALPRRRPDAALQLALAGVLENTAPSSSSSTAATATAPPVPSPRSEPASAGDDAVESEERHHQMEEIAGSLENVARLLRGRGVYALFRNEPDPLNQRLLGVIADHLAARDSG
jgi:hypothetical protein